MKRTCNIDEKQIIAEWNYKAPLFDIPNDIHAKPMNTLKQCMETRYDNMNYLYIQRTNVLQNAKNIDLDLKQSIYEPNQITTCNMDDSFIQDSPLFFNKYIGNEKKIKTKDVDNVFKPIQYYAKDHTNTGIELDLYALILNSFNPIPNPKVFLEETTTLIRDYSVTVVIDTSYSCFNSLSSSHSLQTIVSILSSLSFIDIPCFDLIIATKANPIVLCSHVKTLDALNEKSPLWGNLFAILQNVTSSITRSDLASAICTAFELHKMSTLNYTNLLFVLTDGIHEKIERTLLELELVDIQMELKKSSHKLSFLQIHQM